MNFKRYLIVALIFFSVPSLAQNAEQEINMEDIIESIAENLPEDYDLSELTETLYRLKKNPINLNKATTEELKQIIFLSPLQIGNLLSHIKENGKLIDLLELQAIDGFDLNTIKNLLPFVTLSNDTSYSLLTLENLFKLSENDLIIRFGRIIEKQKGFKDLPGNKYLGSPERFQTRYKYYFNQIISISLTLDKDAGEKFIAQPFDFVSANIALNKLGKIKKLVIGDYSLQFGQGLTLWSGFAFGKGADVTSIAKKDLGLKPYSSTNEYSFLRGIASSINIYKNILLTTFISFRNLDANQTLNPDGNWVQATVNQTGLHRTATEINHRNTLKQSLFGGALQYQSSNLNAGIIAYHSQFNHDFVTQKAVYDQFSFTGPKLSNAGVHYSYTFRNIYFFGELAKSIKSGSAHINGALISLSPTVALAVQYRDYDKNYYSFFNQAIAKASEAINEKGFYTGLNIIPNKRWSFSVYSDYFEFPWLKYRVDAPSKGYEILGQAVYTPTKTFKVIARFKTENRQQNTDLVVPINYLDDVKKEGYRLHADWQINKKFSFQNRIEVSQFKKGNANREFGYLIYQDASFPALLPKLKTNLRLAYFNTPSYNSRIYAYEDDVLYSLAFSMYNGNGFRSYLNLKYSLGKKIDIWARYASFIYKNTPTVGTYLDEIEGNKKSDIKLQMRYQF